MDGWGVWLTSDWMLLDLSDSQERSWPSQGWLVGFLTMLCCNQVAILRNASPGRWKVISEDVSRDESLWAAGPHHDHHRPERCSTCRSFSGLTLSHVPPSVVTSLLWHHSQGGVVMLLQPRCRANAVMSTSADNTSVINDCDPLKLRAGLTGPQLPPAPVLC